MYVMYIKWTSVLKIAGSFAVSDGWIHNGKFARRSRLVFIEDGECTYEFEFKKYSLKSGDFIVIPQNSFYKSHTNSYCKYDYFHFSSEYIGETEFTNDVQHLTIPNGISVSRCFFLPEYGKASDTLRKYLKNILEEKTTSSMSAERHMNILFLNALNHLSDIVSNNDKYKIAFQIYDYIIQNLCQPITLTSIAQHFGYTKQHIINEFKHEYGVTPTDFIIKKRLDLSTEYLLETNMQISEISQKCGFNTPHYYSRKFHEKFDLSPEKYRQKYGTGISY